MVGMVTNIRAAVTPTVVLMFTLLSVFTFLACNDSNSGITPSDPNAGARNSIGISSAEVLSLRSDTDGSGNSGVHVTGTGKVSAKPDIAIISLGVEATEPKVSTARSVAAAAMNKIISTLRKNNIDDSSIKTSHFNIQPQYQYLREQRKLIGYRVSNNLSVEMKNLDSLGIIIDQVVEAGGDVTRIGSITFSIQNGAVLSEEARKLAVEDGLEKAAQLAAGGKFQLGKLMYISEIGGDVFPKNEMRFSDGAASRAMMSPTPIIAGDLDVTISVKMVFRID